jgi:glycerol dehydrogenase-like iron-containing ADH family enzyme
MENNEQEKSKGLGDTIAKITEATGIKKVVETVAKATGKDCGCGQRQDTLNRLFPYNK